jgi:hypothetical protein
MLLLIFILMLRPAKDMRANHGTFKDILLKMAGRSEEKRSSALLR